MDTWRITYRLEPVADVAPHAGYPELGIRLRVEDGKLIEIEHVVDVPEGGDALLISYPKICALCELLEFHWRMPSRIVRTGSSAVHIG